MKLGREIYCRHQGAQVGKARNKRSLTIKYSLATVGEFQRNPCGSIQTPIGSATCSPNILVYLNNTRSL